ncbi:MAG TPA: G8 domain-containing protein, partial [Planctomycetaceae bacterium]|nr:G8 domain-containing protein [Planctomycetaceae bacterium]
MFLARNSRLIFIVLLGLISQCKLAAFAQHQSAHKHDHRHEHVEFNIRSAHSGSWSDPKIWEPSRVPKEGDRVLLSRDTVVEYDAKNEAVIRLVQVVGTLRFSRDRDTELNVGVLKVQSSDVCSESGFACDFEGVNFAGEPIQARTGTMPTLEVGTLDQPIPAEFTARIRLHHLPGFDEKDAPALVCCSARMELHGSPLSRTWVKLGQDVQAEDTAIVLSEDVSGWKVGDEVIVTGSKRADHRRSYRNEPDAVRTEERKITKIEGRTL